MQGDLNDANTGIIRILQLALDLCQVMMMIGALASILYYQILIVIECGDS